MDLKAEVLEKQQHIDMMIWNIEIHRDTMVESIPAARGVEDGEEERFDHEDDRSERCPEGRFLVS